MIGGTVGGFVPELWGASALSIASLVFSAVGGFAGVWLMARLADS
jgi:uncharacterized membrane protein YeaQ/YmgE (transglycosylase-associated protein family)